MQVHFSTGKISMDGLPTKRKMVPDNELVCESGPEKQYGYLCSNIDYKNLDLTLEFKQEANGNSGVFFRTSI